MANGLARGADGLIYVPDTLAGTISVYSINRPSPSPSSVNFTLIGTVPVGMPLDNLALDKNGDLWVAGFADGVKLMQWIEDPVNVKVSGTIWRVKKAEEGKWKVEKMVEDKEAAILNAVTVARHDAKSGRLFMGGEFMISLLCLLENCQGAVLIFIGAFNDFVVCEPRV